MGANRVPSTTAESTARAERMDSSLRGVSAKHEESVGKLEHDIDMLMARRTDLWSTLAPKQKILVLASRP